MSRALKDRENSTGDGSSRSTFLELTHRVGKALGVSDDDIEQLARIFIEQDLEIFGGVEGTS